MKKFFYVFYILLTILFFIFLKSNYSLKYNISNKLLMNDLSDISISSKSINFDTNMTYEINHSNAYKNEYYETFYNIKDNKFYYKLYNNIRNNNKLMNLSISIQKHNTLDNKINLIISYNSKTKSKYNMNFKFIINNNTNIYIDLKNVTYLNSIIIFNRDITNNIFIDLYIPTRLNKIEYYFKRKDDFINIHAIKNSIILQDIKKINSWYNITYTYFFTCKDITIYNLEKISIYVVDNIPYYINYINNINNTKDNILNKSYNYTFSNNDLILYSNFKYNNILFKNYNILKIIKINDNSVFNNNNFYIQLFLLYINLEEIYIYNLINIENNKNIILFNNYNKLKVLCINTNNKLLNTYLDNTVWANSNNINYLFQDIIWDGNEYYRV